MDAGDKTPSRFRRIAWRGLKVAMVMAALFHLYALSLRFITPPPTLTMLQRGWAGADVQRDWARLEDISPHMIEAVMAGEDGRFCEHRGIDWQAIESAIEDNKDGGRRRGGSTITQQTAKNVFLWNGGGYPRKAAEAWLATFIDIGWGKTRVMEVYLNVAEWGDGIFGIEQAAQSRFGKPARDLTRREAALLAAVLPSPNKWRVDPPSEFVAGRAGTLQKRMAVIRDSQYASCVTGASLPLPRNPESETEESTPTPNKDTSLDEILDRAEESLKESGQTDDPDVQTPEPETEKTDGPK